MFSGSAYYYFQHDSLNSNSYFNIRRGLPKKNRCSPISRAPGSAVRLALPGIYDGRGKAFFFFNYEESRSPGQNTENRTVLHPRARRDGRFN